MILLNGKYACWPLLGMLCVVGCSSTSSPSDPGAAPLATIEGQMVPDDVLFQALSPGSGDTIRVEVDEFVVVEGEAPVFDLLLGVGIGRLNAAADACTTTSSRILSAGESWVLHLASTGYCLSLFDPGILPDETVSNYRVLIFRAN
jgi:hypothetical protein